MPEAQAFVLVGPTATGKTAVAHHIAARRGYDILSADSMLVYRGMDIGTAKPTAAQRVDVRYWCLDLVDPGTRFTVAQFCAAASHALQACAADGRRMLVVGGTGLYVRSLVEGLSALPDGDTAVREGGERLLAAGGVAALQAAVREKAPRLYAELSDKQNPRRLLRALELAEAGIHWRPKTWGEPSGRPMLVGLRMDSGLLKERIRKRVAAMYDTGFLGEVESLLEQGIEQAPTAAQAIGYAEAIAHLRGRCTREEGVARTATRTWQLAKRQMTWFRHQANVTWVDVGAMSSETEVASQVEQAWVSSGPVTIA